MKCKAIGHIDDPRWTMPPVECELEEGHLGSHYAKLPYPKDFGAMCWSDENTVACKEGE